MYRKFCCLIILALLFSLGALAPGDDSASDDSARKPDDPAAFASRVLAVTDVVLQKHIDPPARQQMILAGVKALYRSVDRQVPQELAGQISELATHDQFAEYLDGVREEFSELSSTESILTLGILSVVPGDSQLVEAKDRKVQEQVINNRYVGTGIALRSNPDESLPQISKVFYNGPAWKAGVKLNDLILEVDGESMASKPLIQVVEPLRGEAGSHVEVVVRQPDSKNSRRLTMTRGRVFIPSVEGVGELPDGQMKYTLDSVQDIALLHFKSVGPSTLHELRQIAAKLRRQNIRGVVIDLRQGGGILHDIVMVADSLIDGGTIGHVRSLNNSIKHEARSGDIFDGLPIVVLVGKTTSPGSVFLTAAFQDNNRAVVVGEPTIGETYASSFVSIPGRADQVKLATAVLLRGDRTPLLPVRDLTTLNFEQSDAQPTKLPGFIIPDHVVHTVPQQTTAHQQRGSDPVLVKAIEVLESSIATDLPLQSESATGE